MSKYIDQLEDTICALITAPGKAGVSVFRVSGSGALRLTQKLFPKLPASLESHRVYFSTAIDRESAPIDECLVAYFADGKSFTGDETLEISTHGGLAIANKLLSELVFVGCRPAERGEFSFRAFYNGKLDLIQAEAVLGLIHSETESARKMSLKQLKGKLSDQIIHIEDTIIKVLAQLEASIDFSTEDIEPYSIGEIQTLVDKAIADVTPLVLSFKRGRVVSEGLRVVICGPPNAGKSSLYNAVIGKNRSIVSATAGTTRDFIEYTFRDTGLPIHIVDTAGLRVTQDEIEAQGIARSMDQIKDADLAIIVLDASDFKNKDFDLPSPLPQHILLVYNKVDLVDRQSFELSKATDYSKSRMNIHADILSLACSIKNSEGIQDIKGILENLSLVDIDQQENLVTQYRQADLLEKTLTALVSAQNLLLKTTSYDLITIHMQESLRAIYAVLGKEFDDQVLDRVFKEFCIGK